MISIGLGVGALVFAFFMVFSDPQQGPQIMAQGGQIIQQIKDSTATIGKSQDQTALGPESRLDMNMNAAPLPSAADLSVRSGVGEAPAASNGGNNSSIDSYLDGAWDTPKATQQKQMGVPQNFNQMPQPRMQQRGFSQQGFARSSGFTQYRRGVPVQQMRGHPQRGFPQQGFRQQGFPGAGGGQGMGDFRQMIQEMNQGGGGGMGTSADLTAKTNSARGAVENELSIARNQASQARGCLSRARDAEDRSEKQSAASEARSHASQAIAAASRARSRAAGISELQGLADQAHNFANQAENSANDAQSAAGGW